MNTRGRLIALEGIDNSGKTAAVKLLQPRLAADCRVPVLACGELQSPAADLLRRLLQTGGSVLLKTYMFALDRAWTYEQVFIPAFERGSLVLWDRYTDSAIAYRAAELMKGPSLIDLKFVKMINEPFIPPDLTLCFDVDVDTSMQRGKKAGKHLPYDRDVLERVRKQYALLAMEKEYRVIDGRRPLSDIVKEIERVIKSQFPELFA